MNGKILITGGSGFLGINLVRDLLARGYTNIASLDLEPFDYPEIDRIHAVIGDIRHRDTVRELMKDVKWVVHCAAALPLYTPEDIYSTDVEGTRILTEEALTVGVERFVHISSTAVYGIPDHHPLVETDRLIGVGPYGEAKIEAEKVCEAAREKGLCAPILRPKSFIGPERLGVFVLLYDWALDGRHFPMIGSGKNRYQLMAVEDLCDAIHLCLTGPAEKTNDVFNAGAEDYTTMGEDYQVVLDYCGHGRRIIPFPAKPAIIALRLLEKLGWSPLYKWVYETACEDSFVSIDKAKKQLGWQPKYSNKNALLRNLVWYIRNKDSFAGKSGVSHRVPWKQGILGLIKKLF